MNLIKITELTRQLGLSSRTLRYYEQIGLISSVRMPSESYRYYDDLSIQRLHQIIILRKMQIPEATFKIIFPKSSKPAQYNSLCQLRPEPVSYK